MERGHRTRAWAALTAAFLLLCAAPESAEAGSRREGGPGLESGTAKSVRLALKISSAKKRKRRVSFYRSVARQARIGASASRSPSSGR